MWLVGQVNVSACSHLNLMEMPRSGDRGGHQRYLDHTAVLHSWAPPEHTTSCRLTALHFPFPYGLQANVEVSCSPLASSYMLCANTMRGKGGKKNQRKSACPKMEQKGESKKSRAPGCPTQCTMPSLRPHPMDHQDVHHLPPGEAAEAAGTEHCPKLVLKWKVCKSSAEMSISLTGQSSLSLTTT